MTSPKIGRADLRWRVHAKGSEQRDLHLKGQPGLTGRVAVVFGDGRWFAGGDNECGGFTARGQAADRESAQGEAMQAVLVGLNQRATAGGRPS